MDAGVRQALEAPTRVVDLVAQRDAAELVAVNGAAPHDFPQRFLAGLDDAQRDALARFDDLVARHYARFAAGAP